MTVIKNIKTANSKTKQSKGHYDLDRQTAKISDLSWENVDKY